MERVLEQVDIEAVDLNALDFTELLAHGNEILRQRAEIEREADLARRDANLETWDPLLTRVEALFPAPVREMVLIGDGCYEFNPAPDSGYLSVFLVDDGIAWFTVNLHLYEDGSMTWQYYRLPLFTSAESEGMEFGPSVPGHPEDWSATLAEAWTQYQNWRARQASRKAPRLQRDAESPTIPDLQDLAGKLERLETWESEVVSGALLNIAKSLAQIQTLLGYIEARA